MKKILLLLALVLPLSIYAFKIGDGDWHKFRLAGTDGHYRTFAIKQLYNKNTPKGIYKLKQFDGYPRPLADLLSIMRTMPNTWYWFDEDEQSMNGYVSDPIVYSIIWAAYMNVYANDIKNSLEETPGFVDWK